MELKRIEITGFKSFADKLVLTFDGGITAVVGPNGSGKSNIADAIRWVLGEQSAKTLRGSKMEDVIFAGTERRKPVSYAQVVLVLDNHDHLLKSDYDEVAISRKMYRSGESEYLINGVRCRLKDVQELLMDTGIGKDGYSMIGQGRIDQLLSNKPQDRRLLFEEASGIVRYKTRRDEANKELGEVQNNLSRVQDVLNEASSRLEPLHKQADEAREYLKLSEELREHELRIFLKQVGVLDKQYAEAKEKADLLSEQLTQARAKNDSAQQAEQNAAEASRKASEDLEKLMAEISDLRVSRENRDGEKKLHEQALNQYQRERRNAQERLEEVMGRIARRSSTYARETAELEKLRRTCEEQESRQQEIEAKRSAFEEEARALSEQKDVLLKQAYELSEQLEELRARLTRQQVLSEQDQGEREHLLEEMKNLQSDVEEKTSAARNVKEQLDEAKKHYREEAQAVIALTDEISQIRSLQHAAGEEKIKAAQHAASLHSRAEWLKELDKEYEGYSNTVRVLMQYCAAHPEQYGGVYGTVAELCEVPEKYAVPIEIALGAAVQNIVADNQQTVHRLIDYLHEKKAGRATFLPLSDVSGRKVDEREAVLSMEGIIGFADELISFDPRYQGIYSRLLGNVILADQYDHAAAAARRFGRFLRVVTLRGDMFNIGGSITGGSSVSRNASILSRKGELDTLRTEMKAAEKELAAKTAEENRLTELRRQKNDEIQQRSARRDQWSARVSALQSDYDQSEVRLQMAAEQLIDRQKNSRIAHESLEAGQESLKMLQQQCQEKQAGKEQLDIQVKAKSQALDQARKQIEEVRSTSMQLRIEVSTSQQLIHSMENSVEREKNENLQDLSARDQYSEQIREAAEAITRLEQEEQESAEELTTIRQQLESKTALVHDQSLLRDQKEEEYEKARTLTKNCAEVVFNLEKEAYRLEGQESRAHRELTEAQDRIWEKYGLTRHAAEEMNLSPLVNAAAANRRINELRSSIRALGTVNVNAVEEHEELEKRCSFLSGQLSDIHSAEADLKKIIGELTEQMENQFREGFSRISEQFNKVFAQMFNGGHASLRLEEESNPLESGIEIVAQPPGKTVRSMAALSGGERALTAIAILFAIQQLKPAPFCILDEIEAALDDANVDRYARFLKTLCDTTQFIVITHRKGTMEAADTMYGITMEEKGISRCISVKFE